MQDILNYLQREPTVFVAICGLLGLVVGSFFNVVIHRLPKMMEREWRQQCIEYLQWEIEKHPKPLVSAEQLPVESPERYNLLMPPSACPHCQHKLAAWENIPILSYLLLRGRCRSCQAPISPRYPLVEASCAVLTAWAAAHFGYGVAAALAIVLLWSLLVLTMIDFDTQLLPDDITLPLLWLGLLANLFGVFTNIGSAVIGAAVGYLVLWSLYWLFKLLTGKEGMGYGDFKLLAALGAWFGWQMLPLIVVLSAVVGAVVGVSLMIFARNRSDTPIPFGPYLAGGGVVALFFGGSLMAGYWQFMAV